MHLPMRRLLLTPFLALLALCALASTALGATHKPTITSVSPKQVAVGGTLTLKGKYFASGARNNRVFLSRASDGKAVRVRPKTASKTRMTVVVPKTLTTLLADDGTGGKKPTRFRLMVFTKVLGPKTKTSLSPVVFPSGAVVPGAPNSGTTTTPGAPAPDCDTDGIPDAQDADDDNDGLPDSLEASIHTDPCKADTDNDGVPDAYEYYSSLDLNGAPNYAGKRPYPNPLDASDADADFDGDGLTQTEEYKASLQFGTAKSAPLTYSDGNQQSVAPANSGAMDLDQNGRITDDEKDADNDNLANWVEIAKGEPDPDPAWGCSYTDSTNGLVGVYVNIYTVCNGGPMMPNGNTMSGTKSVYITGAAPAHYNGDRLNWLDPDSDGDGIPDGADDMDFDGLSNYEEITAGTDGYYTAPFDPCDPNPDSRSCPTHPAH
jgi:hypothetical protein